MSNCCKTIRSEYPYCAVKIEMHSRDLQQLDITPVQLVSVLFIMVLRCSYSSLKFLIFLILVCELFLQVHDQ